MNRDRFLSLRFKPFMELNFVTRRVENECFYYPVMLLAIDWDNDTFKVVPFPRTELEEIEFWTSRDHIELPTKRMRVVDK